MKVNSPQKASPQKASPQMHVVQKNPRVTHPMLVIILLNAVQNEKNLLILIVKI